MGAKRSLVCGFGINDASYMVAVVVDGDRIVCPYYAKWARMLRRCYSKSVHEERPTYADCFVCDEWKVFSAFKSWMEQQDWQGKELDKDILIPGNKIYSPEACCFVDARTNTFITDCGASRKEGLIGTYYDKPRRLFMAQVSNVFSGKRERLGRFKDELDAHLAWKNRKHELACQLADLQTDERVANALRKRYAD